MTGATSTPFNVAAFGNATKLLYGVQPTNTAVGATIAPPLQVFVADGLNNVVTTSTASVGLAFGANPGGATLGGTTTVAAVSGVATFSNLTVSAAGNIYNLAASSAGLASATSNTFNVVDPAAAIVLAFSAQPTATTAGSIVTPNVAVAIRNSSNATVTSANNAITLSIASGPAGATLGGTTTVTAVNGIAAFTNLSITTSGAYTLKATASGLNNGTSASFAISPSVATKLAVTAQPTTMIAGQVIATPLVVQIQDQYGNLVTTASNPITVEPGVCGGNVIPSATGPYFGGTLTISAANGVATFSNIRPRRATRCSANISASATGLSSASGWNTGANPILPSGATQLGFVQNIGTPTANVAFYASIVEFADSLGNITNQGSNVVTLSIGTNPSVASLSGATVIAATTGSATFSNIAISKGGTGYTLVAKSSGVSDGTSNTFNVNAFGAAAQLAFTVQPSSTAAGAAIAPSIQVSILDAVGNAVTNSTVAVTIALGANPGGSSIGGTFTVNAVNGVATFTNITLSKAASGYTLSATSVGLGTTLSNTFTITP